MIRLLVLATRVIISLNQGLVKVSDFKKPNFFIYIHLYSIFDTTLIRGCAFMLIKHFPTVLVLTVEATRLE